MGIQSSRTVEWNLFARGVFTMVSYEAGMICAVFGGTLASEVFIGMGMTISGVSLLDAARHRLRQHRQLEPVTGNW